VSEYILSTCRDWQEGKPMSPIRVLVVDDYKDWRNLVRSLLAIRPEWEIVCEASDGLEAVMKAEELKPDLILLDIGLPKLNGIEAARRIRKLVPESKILILSQERDADVAQEVIGGLGVSGYVVKAWASTDVSRERGHSFRARLYPSFQTSTTLGQGPVQIVFC
jgi:DNA-binding NarL/FixJ family response regulator